MPMALRGQITWLDTLLGIADSGHNITLLTAVQAAKNLILDQTINK